MTPDPHARRQPTREQLFHLLAEASELEHNLLCSYLFALFSLKRGLDEDLTAAELEAIQRWRKELLSVCVEEMVHLTQVANITAALGGRPHFDRPNLPVSPGYHPAGIVVGLTPFNAATLEHFVFLERPDSVALEDTPVVAVPDGLAADQPRSSPARLTPSAPDYATVGEFYGVLRRSLEAFAADKGDAAFAPQAFQLEGRLIRAESLLTIGTVGDALLAIDRIVEQGEGASHDEEDSHFARFTAMLEELNALQAARPGFEPSRRVGSNPVMRAPQAAERTHVTAEKALACLDAFNAVYWMMLRTLAALYALRPQEKAAKALVGHMLGCMHLLSDLSDPLTRHPASDDAPEVMAGPSFTMYRHAEGASDTLRALAQLHERCTEIAAGVETLPTEPPFRQRLSRQLAGMADGLRAAIDDAAP